MSVERRLDELGITLPEVAVPVANYVPAIRSGNYIYTSGQLPLVGGELTATGQLGSGASVDEAAAAARTCALNAIAAAAAVADGVDNLARAVKVTGFVSSAADFFSHPQVVNGASDLLAEVFGSPHARSAVGVAALPLDASVEVEVVFELA